MYALYHHFLHKIKQDEIRQYNQMHRDYLIRSGQIADQPPVKKITRNQNTNNANYQSNRAMQRVENEVKQPQIVQAKPRRQRQFNRPNTNNQANQMEERKTNDDQIKVQKRNQFARPKPNRVQVQQQQPRKTVEVDRPIKQNKLTPEQIQFLNQNSVNESKNPPQNKKPLRQQQPIKQNPKKETQLTQYEDVKVTLIECGICGRKFKQQALLKHENICQKVFQQKRKPFEVKITDEQAELLKRKNEKQKGDKKQEKKEDQPKWKNQSEILRNLIKKGRGQKVENEIIEEDTRIPCPGCGRRFNDKAAAKHIQFCTKKPKKPNKN